RTIPHELREPFAERVIHFAKNASRDRKAVSKRLAHADGLAALTRKDKGDRHIPRPHGQRAEKHRDTHAVKRPTKQEHHACVNVCLIRPIAGRFMSDFVPVTDDDLSRARRDPAFRQLLLAKSLKRLIAELNRLKSASTKIDTARARQIREGVQLAV